MNICEWNIIRVAKIIVCIKQKGRDVELKKKKIMMMLMMIMTVLSCFFSKRIKEITNFLIYSHFFTP